MRINWSNIGKGLEAIANAKMDREREQALASESAKYDVTEGAYGSELLSNINQVKGLKQQAIESGMSPEMAAQQYDPSLNELLRRSALTQADYSIAQGPRDASGMPVNYATRQQAREEAAPLRAEGLSRVYRARGDIEDADRLEARALEQRRGLQQSKLAEYQIGEAKRAADINNEMDAARKVGEDFLSVRAKELGGINNLTESDYNGALQNQIQYLRQKGFQKEANALIKDREQTIAAIVANENEALRRELGAAIASKNLGAIGRAYDTYVKDGARVTGVVENEDKSITVSRMLDNGGKLPPITFKSYEELVASAENLYNPGSMLRYSQTQFENNLRVQAAETQKEQFAARLDVDRDQVDIAMQRHDLNERQFDQAVKTAESKTLAGQIKELKDLGIAVSDEDVKALAGVKEGADTLLKAELEIIAARAKNEANPNYDPAADLARAFQNSASRAQRKTIITDLRAAAKEGKAPEALAKLRLIEGMTEDRVKDLAKQANIPYVAPPVAGVTRNPNAGAGAVPPPVRRPMGTGGPQGLVVNPMSIQP